MRSRAARLTFSAVACIALGAAAAFIAVSEQQIVSKRAVLRAFDLHAREAASAIADARAGQQAYVAAGQGIDFWMPKVAATLQQISNDLDALRTAAVSSAAQSALMDAAAALTELARVDNRARDYVRSGDTLMAGDVVFTEGRENAAAAARQVETARLAEHQARDADEALQRRREAYAAGGAAGLAAVIVGLLGFAGPRANSETGRSEVAAEGRLIAPMPAAVPAAHSERPRGSAPALRAAAALCTEFGRVKDISDLNRLFERAAYLMDATGVVVWLGDTAGRDLRPALAHGYSDQVLSRMPSVPRSADNAAAAAYRSGQLQIVLTRPGVAPGAVVAPLLAPDGCIGALTAEIRDGGETSEGVQALAAIFAAQLAGIVAASASNMPAGTAASAPAAAAKAASA